MPTDNDAIVKVEYYSAVECKSINKYYRNIYENDKLSGSGWYNEVQAVYWPELIDAEYILLIRGQGFARSVHAHTVIGVCMCAMFMYVKNRAIT